MDGHGVWRLSCIIQGCPKCNHMCTYKQRNMWNRHMQRRKWHGDDTGRGSELLALKAGAMWPWAKQCQWPQKLEEARNRLPDIIRRKQGLGVSRVKTDLEFSGCLPEGLDRWRWRPAMQLGGVHSDSGWPSVTGSPRPKRQVFSGSGLSRLKEKGT